LRTRGDLASVTQRRNLLRLIGRRMGANDIGEATEAMAGD